MSINGNISFIKYFKPDKIDPDGTLYYNPFKLVPTLSLLKKNNGNGNDLRYAWDSYKYTPYNVIGFQILSNETDEYLPVGDLIVQGPPGPWNAKADTTYQNNDYSSIINMLQYTSNRGMAGSYVLYVKNNIKYSIKLKRGDFQEVDKYRDDSSWGPDDSIYNNDNITSSGYVIMGTLFGERKTGGMILNEKRRYIAGVHKYYVDDIDSGITHPSASAKNLGTGTWSTEMMKYVSYSSYFSNTWRGDNHSEQLKFRDIIPECIHAICCSGINGTNSNEICVRVKDRKSFCDSFMTNDYCSGDKLVSVECNKWCKTNYCDDNLKTYCANADILQSPSASNSLTEFQPYKDKDIYLEVGSQIKGQDQSLYNSISNDKVTFYKDKNFEGDSLSVSIGESRPLIELEDDITSIKIPQGVYVTLYEDPYYQGGSSVVYSDISNLRDIDWNDKISSFKVEKNKVDEASKVSLEKCRQQCIDDKNCKAFVHSGGYGTCSLREKNSSTIIDSLETSLYFRDGSDTYIKRAPVKKDDLLVQMCSCFKPDQYYTDFFDKISSKYPPQIRDMIKAAASTKDKRCFYPNCISGEIKYRELKDKGTSDVCGNTNLQVCFQNVESTGSSIENSTISQQQEINCQQEIGGSKGNNIQEDNKPVITPPNSKPVITPPNSKPVITPPSDSSTEFLTKYKWWIIGGVVGFVLLLIILLLLMKK